MMVDIPAEDIPAEIITAAELAICYELAAGQLEPRALAEVALDAVFPHIRVQAAEMVLKDHKRGCPACATPRQQMCSIGRGLQNHLWHCQRAQHELRNHDQTPAAEQELKP